MSAVSHGLVSNSGRQFKPLEGGWRGGLLLVLPQHLRCGLLL